MEVVSDKIVRTFTTPRATRAVGLDMLMASDKVSNALVFFKNSKSKSYETLGQVFNFIFLFLINSSIRVVLDGKFLQEYAFNVGLSQGSILGLALFLLYINDLPDDDVCNITVSADTTLLSRCDWLSDLWQ